MAKKKEKQEVSTPKVSRTTRTLAIKAKKIIQSCGVPFFKTWAEKPTTGGKRKKASRSPMKSVLPDLYRRLISSYEDLNRNMDKEKIKT